MYRQVICIGIICLAAIVGLPEMGSAAAMPESNADVGIPKQTAMRDTGDVVFQFTAPSGNTDGMTWDGTNIWLGCDGLDRIWKMDTLGNILDSIPAPNTTATGLTWDGQYLWCADGGPFPRIYKLDPATGAILDSITGPGSGASCEGLAWMNDTMWSTNWADDLIWWLDPITGTVLGQFSSPGGAGSGSTGLTWDWHDNALWNSDQLTDFIYKLDPVTGNIITSFPCPDPEIQDLAFDGTYLWSCGWTSGEVYKMDIGYVQPPANILYVDDDNNVAVSGYFESSFNNLGYGYDMWVVTDSGDVTPDAAVMGNYDIVVWTTGDDYSSTFVGNDTIEVANYLNGGGKMWLSSEDVLWHLGAVGFLHVGSFVSDIGCTQATGIGPITSPITFSTTGGVVIDYSDEVQPDGITWAEMQNETSTNNTIAMDAPYYLFFNAFPFENINTEADRDTMMQRVIDWIFTGIEEMPSRDTPVTLGFTPTMANPVRGHSTIAYTTTTLGRVSLRVYDSAGRLVKTLVNSVEQAGAKTVMWDARDDNRRAVANGVYFLKLEANNQAAVHKLILVK
ncbi:T9SS type A sorting domain-containing protein [candidate division WOR-3 bacterium]|nr:T9SS type A sorting domain-containing protein [candidate division WOR-3 bacterium]